MQLSLAHAEKLEAPSFLVPPSLPRKNVRLGIVPIPLAIACQIEYPHLQAGSRPLRNYAASFREKIRTSQGCVSKSHPSTSENSRRLWMITYSDVVVVGAPVYCCIVDVIIELNISGYIRLEGEMRW